ncbi:probable polygalacturonase At1g80170 [Andrographis paniculata]|uniref:probable polygalacturonase At1g80170 n=1 Tax=Andrographis paniculata TaxID=175694 RepID=UPI0021E83954|nr:probable polygalacturonase At1g80170 [Andrographis paniculata]
MRLSLKIIIIPPVRSSAFFLEVSRNSWKYGGRIAPSERRFWKNMAGLQRSAVSFRRQGSSGSVWDDKSRGADPAADAVTVPEKWRRRLNRRLRRFRRAVSAAVSGKVIRRAGGRLSRRSAWCERFLLNHDLCFLVPSPAFGNRIRCVLVQYTALCAIAGPELPTDRVDRSSSTAASVFNIDDFGAKGDGLSDDTKSFQAVWKTACSSSRSVKIVIPARKSYLIKPTDFAGPCKSKVTLRVSGLIRAPQDPAVWEGRNIHKWLYFHGVNNLKVDGGGTINGMGKDWWDRSCKINNTNPCTSSPTAVTFHRCRNLKVRNITITDAQRMHIAFTTCTRVVVSKVGIVAPGDSPNTDGIHISASKNVKVENVFIATGDDCISIVSNSSKIRIKNAACGPGHGISIGSLGKNSSCDSVEDVVVNGSFFFNTENGARIKTWQGGSGSVKKITFENLWMKNVANPIIIDQYYCDRRGTCPNQTSAVRIDDVSFKGIRGTSGTEKAITLACSDSCPCRRLHLEDIDLAAESDEAIKSFCWEAFGTSSGFVYPTSCLSSGDVIMQPVRQSTVSGFSSGFDSDSALL